MLIDTSDVATANRKFLEASTWAMENIHAANAAIDVLQTACYVGLDDADHVTVLRLAVRLINAAGSAGDAAIAGYYQPAASQIRDLIEVGFLIDLFRRDPSKVTRWREIDHAQRRNEFAARELRKVLDKLDGNTAAKRAEAYQFFTRHGTHADPESIGLTSPNQWTHVGPFPDRDRVLGLSFDMARYLAAATEFLVIWLLQQAIPAGPKAEICAGHIIKFREQVDHMVTRTSSPRD